MCGIMGYTGYANAVPVIIDGLCKLEYRGYDSAGIAIYREEKLEITKKKGRLADLVKCLGHNQESSLGIGHTRWATHGVPSDSNAHPHSYSEGDCSPPDLLSSTAFTAAITLSGSKGLRI